MVNATNVGCLGNATGVTEFLLLGFQVLPEVQPVLFTAFLIIYIITVAGNVLIVVMVSVDVRLHSPMYFFLGNLSFLEIWYPTTTVPTMIAGILTGGRRVSYAGCISQFYFFVSFAATECFLLTVMAYDRYVAICFPLHYTVLMEKKLCLKLVLSAWAGGFSPPVITIVLLCRLRFIGSQEIDHFFCEFAPLLKITCSETSVIEMYVFIIAASILSVPFSLIIISYAYIMSAILKIPSAVGRHRTFSTCSSHLTVVIIYFGTLITIYVSPTTGRYLNLNKALSLLYTVATPLMNPIIYALRNKEIQNTLSKTFRMFGSPRGLNERH
ncbi:olfactory receptor 11L1-like [Ambystoma mexicanum]|uniref:olfactory receptor 11L1-like n=1 Tax=Ambystoma mexicanum TaxID=8296 RepID=UPI0037E8DD89